ncbi:uncharacterized protein LOC128956649 [Oppia nitens]|uniref:uncharacterized protein LOC128956649 n=1 Tax=Oppia nitens TaxID=1686743 RepID=UPI0023DB743E|nr:uncharacterized protein LOC128956649 [Oppia nitens]
MSYHNSSFNFPLFAKGVVPAVQPNTSSTLRVSYGHQFGIHKPIHSKNSAYSRTLKDFADHLNGVLIPGIPTNAATLRDVVKLMAFAEFSSAVVTNVPSHQKGMAFEDAWPLVKPNDQNLGEWRNRYITLKKYEFIADNY